MSIAAQILLKTSQLLASGKYYKKGTKKRAAKEMCQRELAALIIGFKA